jgi:hypothetical protein
VHWQAAFQLAQKIGKFFALTARLKTDYLKDYTKFENQNKR